MGPLILVGECSSSKNFQVSLCIIKGSSYGVDARLMRRTTLNALILSFASVLFSGSAIAQYVLYSEEGVKSKNPKFPTQLAYNLVALGDVDGDGVSDFVVDDQKKIAGFEKTFGRIHLVSGRTGVVKRTFAANRENMLCGSPLGGGDLNGDGVPDLAYMCNTAFSNGPQFDPFTIIRSGADGSIIRRLNEGLFYSELIDINNDGISEFIRPHYASDEPVSDEGVVLQVLSSTTLEEIYRFSIDSGHVNKGVRGHELLKADFNGDGIDDIAIPREIEGPWDESWDTATPVSIHSGANGEELFRLERLELDESLDWYQMGVSLKSQTPPTDVKLINDLDGDGLGELAVAYPNKCIEYDIACTRHEGWVGIYSSVDGSLIRKLLGRDAPDFSDDDNHQDSLQGPYFPFGVLVRNIGDINGDGYDELMIGSHRSLTVYSTRNFEVVLFEEAPASALSPTPNRMDITEVVPLGDLNGDGLAEYVRSITTHRDYRGRYEVITPDACPKKPDKFSGKCGGEKKKGKGNKKAGKKKGKKKSEKKRPGKKKGKKKRPGKKKKRGN